MSVLNNTTVNGVVTQTQAATQSNHLIRLGEAQALMAALFQGPWSNSTTYVSGQFATDQGSLYLSRTGTLNQQPSANPSVWTLAASKGADGASAYNYVAFASDTSGTGFSLSPGSGLNYVAFKSTTSPISSPQASDFTGLWKRYVGADGAAGAAGADGQSVYVGYASDSSGTGFSLSPSSGLNYVALKKSATALTQASDFAGLWKKYVGTDGAAGAAGADGQSMYVAFASDSSGTGFSLSPSSGLGFVAFKKSATALTQASDFAGLWVQYVGAAGATGAAGSAGAAGQSAYLYMGFASDSSGTNFSLTPGSTLNYVAFKNSTTVISSPQASDFTGLWKNYAGTSFTVSGAVTYNSGVLGLNAASANTASYLVQRDGSGNFSGGAVSVVTLIVNGVSTLSIASGALNVNTTLVVPNLTVGSVSGVLKASAGVVAGSATTDDLTEGSTNQYFTAARVRATVLTGISSTHVIQATDTILVAFGKIDAILGGSYPAGSISGNLNINGNLTVTGSTTLATSLGGVLKATSGVVAGSATTDDLTEGSTNVYWTQTRFNNAIAAIKNANSGICPLDSSGKVPLANLYTTGATPFGAASQSAMLALSSAKQGDFAMRSDTGITYILSNNAPGTLSNWVAWAYPVMSVNGAVGAVVLTTDNISVGSTNLYWTQTLFDNAIAAIKGANSGICPLDSSGLVPTANLPPVGNSIWIVNSQVTQTNLSTSLKGDIANRTDQNITYVLSNNSPGTFGSWVPILYPVASVNGLTGTVSLTTTNVAEGSNLYFTNARAIAATLTGFTAGAGSVSSSDTVLSALQKVAANISGAIGPSGGNITGTLRFTSTSAWGFAPSQLTTTQINGLTTSSTGDQGALVYDTTTHQLKALLNGTVVVISAGASLPLSGGSGSPLTGQIFFQDGLSTFVAWGNSWNSRVSNSDNNFDILQGGTTGGTVVLTLDASTNNVKAPNGFFDTGSGGGYKINGNTILSVVSSQLAFNMGGNWVVTTTASYADYVVNYNGSAVLTIDQTGNTEVPGTMKATAFKVGSNQVVGAQQSAVSDPPTATAWTDGTAQNDFNTGMTVLQDLITKIRTHGLINT